jgi:hypothetical protein
VEIQASCETGASARGRNRSDVQPEGSQHVKRSEARSCRYRAVENPRR